LGLGLKLRRRRSEDRHLNYTLLYYWSVVGVEDDGRRLGRLFHEPEQVPVQEDLELGLDLRDFAARHADVEGGGPEQCAYGDVDGGDELVTVRAELDGGEVLERTELLVLGGEVRVPARREEEVVFCELLFGAVGEGDDVLLGFHVVGFDESDATVVLRLLGGQGVDDDRLCVVHVAKGFACGNRNRARFVLKLRHDWRESRFLKSRDSTLVFL
jgi:hypothetical protein